MFSTMFQQDFEFYIITRLVTWETRDLPSSLPNWGAVKQSCLHILTPWKVRTAVSRDSGCAFLNVLAGLACLVACTFTWHHCQSVHCCAAQTKEQLAVGGNNNKGTSTSACSIAQTCRPADLSSSRVLIKLTLQNYCLCCKIMVVDFKLFTKLAVMNFLKSCFMTFIKNFLNE